MGPTAVEMGHVFDDALQAGREPFKVADLSLAAFGRKNMDPSLQMMVHDLKNVLTVIETNLELMELKKFQDCEQSVQISRHNSRVLFYLIQDMSDIWKLQAGKGLGLAFCRLAAEGHGGSIRYVSGGKTGNHITLELPAGNQS